MEKLQNPVSNIMIQLLAATHNKHKLDEIRYILSKEINLLSLDDIGFVREIPEDKDTFRGNALQKARFVYQETGMDCFADDSGLEVDALGGKPGIYSARYAGEKTNFEKNNEKLLAELHDIADRAARFFTVVALIMGGKELFFEGEVRGRIIDSLKGKQGFGYDPLFIPDGYDKTFAELPAAIKNDISHRANAMKKLNDFLKMDYFSNTQE